MDIDDRWKIARHGFIWHLDGVQWWEAPIPPRRHECTPQTFGYAGGLTSRCACGAIASSLHPRAADWDERNSRRDDEPVPPSRWRQALDAIRRAVARHEVWSPE